MTVFFTVGKLVKVKNLISIKITRRASPTQRDQLLQKIPDHKERNRERWEVEKIAPKNQGDTKDKGRCFFFGQDMGDCIPLHIS